MYRQLRGEGLFLVGRALVIWRFRAFVHGDISWWLVESTIVVVSWSQLAGYSPPFPNATSMLIFFGRLGIEEPENLRMRWQNVWTREKNAVPPDTGAGASYQTSHPGISARAIAFGRRWPFVAFCYRPCLPVRHWGRDMSAPKPYVTNPTPTHSSKPPLSI